MEIHDFVSFLGRNIKGCKAFGGWGVDGATNSNYFDYGWEVWYICHLFLVVSSTWNMLL